MSVDPEYEGLCLRPVTGHDQEKAKLEASYAAEEKKKPIGPWFQEYGLDGSPQDTNDNSPVSFDEFTRKTTFHGVRYIFDNSFRVRRYDSPTLSFEWLFSQLLKLL